MEGRGHWVAHTTYIGNAPAGFGQMGEVSGQAQIIAPRKIARALLQERMEKMALLPGAAGKTR